MIRAIVTLIFVCLSVSAFKANTSGPIINYFVALAILLVLDLLLALPLFLFLAWRHWLQWWQLIVGGLVTALIVLFVTVGFNDEVFWLTNVLWKMFLCTLASYVFWFAGIWRNKRFPYVLSVRVPLSSLVLWPIWALVLFAHSALLPSWTYGRLESLVDIGKRGRGTAIVRLDNGQIVNAPMLETYAQVPEAGSCVDLYTRRTNTLAAGRLYWAKGIHKCYAR